MSDTKEVSRMSDEELINESLKIALKQYKRERKLYYRILEPFKRFWFALSRACWEFVEAWRCYYE